ncbi:M20/M25/M40 family metallo-hydrolase [bacterium]|nr:M20/M25/M40 family metallo-hydrolase [bacterium]
MYQRLAEHVERHRADLQRFASELIRTPSPSGGEGAVASLVAEAMRAQGFDDVRIDEVGNVVGVIRGANTGPSVLFCSHLDTGEPAELERWAHPPCEPVEADGYLLGLGAADSKGAIASQVFGAAALRALAAPLSGDVVVAGVVMAEQAEAFGVGHLFDVTLPAMGLSKPALAVMGDPTGLDLYLGQRGRLELELMTIGRTAHAAVPGLGVNAAYKMAGIVEDLQALSQTLPSHPFLEKSTVALTNLECAPARFSIIPDRCVASIDRRFLPTESLDTVVMQIQSLISRAAEKDPNFKAEVRIRTVEEKAYTGVTKQVPKLLSPFLTSDKHPMVVASIAALTAVGQAPRFDKWCFSTEGGYVATIAGVPTIGYAPGEEKYAHTPYDRVRIASLGDAALGMAAIAFAIASQAPGREAAREEHA